MTIDNKDAHGQTIQGENLRFPYFLSQDKFDNFACFSEIWGTEISDACQFLPMTAVTEIIAILR